MIDLLMILQFGKAWGVGHLISVPFGTGGCPTEVTRPHDCAGVLVIE